MILDDPSRLEYEAFRLVNFEFLRSASATCFVSVDEELYRKFLAENPSRFNKNKQKPHTSKSHSSSNRTHLLTLTDVTEFILQLALPLARTTCKLSGTNDSDRQQT